MSISSPVKCEPAPQVGKSCAPPTGERGPSGRWFGPLSSDQLRAYPSLCPVLGDLTIREYQTSRPGGRRVTIELPNGTVLDSGAHFDLANAQAYAYDLLVGAIVAERERRDQKTFAAEFSPLCEAFGEAVAELAKGA